MAKHSVLGINFDHMHMGDLLRAVASHPDAEIAGIFDPDPARMQSAIANFAIPPDRVFTDLEACLTGTTADLAIVCSATAEHAAYVEKIAPHGLNVMVEKPFAASAADARRMIRAMEASGKRLAVNWPLAWYPSHNTAKRLIDEGAIGELIGDPFLRWQSWSPLPSRRQGRGLARGGREAEAGLVVVQAVGRRRQPPRLSRLRRHPRRLVHGRQGAARGDLHC